MVKLEFQNRITFDRVKNHFFGYTDDLTLCDHLELVKAATELLTLIYLLKVHT